MTYQKANINDNMPTSSEDLCFESTSLVDIPGLRSLRNDDDDDGKTWFIANDIAALLEYADKKQAVRVHCKHTKLLKGVKAGQYTTSPRGITTIPQGDVFRLIFNSRLPAAERFQDWVCDEVLPSIRKHGAYFTPKVLEQVLTTPSLLRELAEKIIEEQRKAKIPAGSLILDVEAVPALSRESEYLQDF